MTTSDPAAVPPPEWAYRMSASYHGYDDDEPVGIHREDAVDTLARLLASVDAKGYDRGVREAAGAVIAHPAFVAKYPNDFAGAILSLLHTPPSGGAG